MSSTKSGRFHCLRLVLVLSFTYLKLSGCSRDVEPQMIEDLARSIGAKIDEFAIRVTGSNELNQELSKLSFDIEKSNGEKLVEDISTKLYHFFDKKIKSLRNIVAESEEFYRTYEFDNDIESFRYMNMKDFKDSEYPLHYDNEFKRNVSFNHSGVQVPTDIYDKAPDILNTIKWTQSLEEIFKNNTKEDPSLKWQHFGSETGVLRSYPAKKWPIGPKNIDLYDARKRSWYIHGSSSPKSVVIVVDSSGSMYGRPLLIARLALGELIDTFSDNDFFSVIWFNKDVNHLACEKKFVQATQKNKYFYKEKLKDISASSVAAWDKAYEAAFKMFEEDTGADCQKVIMVFTDGPTERSNSVFKKYNSKKQVRVFTYAVGPPAHSIEALRSIACDNRGHFYRIPDVGSVRDAVKGYVTVLSRPMALNDTHNPMWSNVYLDISGLGMMITGALPIFNRRNDTGFPEILGVTGTDVPLSDIDGLIDHSLLGPSGYFFLINNNGHIIKHPALKSELGYLEEPPGVYVSEIEFGWEVNSTQPLKLREKMLATEQGKIGTMVFDVAKFSDEELPLRVQRKEMKYFFTPIKDTPLRLAIASPKFGFKIVNVTDDTTVSETIVDVLTRFWQNDTNRINDGEAFIETYNGTFKTSSPILSFKPLQGVQSRMEDYVEDTTLISVVQENNKTGYGRLVGYRSVVFNKSGTAVDLAVIGFNVERSAFMDDHFTGASVKDNNPCNRANLDEDKGHYCYLLDENAFVISSNARSEEISGLFFGEVDSEIMRHLVRGRHSSLPNPIYRKIEQEDHQGSCSVKTGDTASSAHILQPFFSVTSYITWSTTKVFWLFAQYNLYNMLFSGSSSVSAEAVEIVKGKNRSCIMDIITYYANVTGSNVTQKGQANCGSKCLGVDDECERSFVVSNVPKTNLFLVVVSASQGQCLTMKSTPSLGTPGQPQENAQTKSVCTKDPYRQEGTKCYTSYALETGYPCGRCGFISASPFVLLLTLLISAFTFHNM